MQTVVTMLINFHDESMLAAVCDAYQAHYSAFIATNSYISFDDTLVGLCRQRVCRT